MSQDCGVWNVVLGLPLLLLLPVQLSGITLQDPAGFSPAPQAGWEPRRVPLSLPAVPPQQLLFLAGMLKSRLLPGILISHLPLSGGIFPGCNYFYLQADKNYPALELGRVLCVLKQLLSSPVKTQKNGEVSFPCAVI